MKTARTAGPLTGFLLLTFIVLTAGTACRDRLAGTSKIPRLDSEYQVVVFANGQVLIGKLEGLGTPYPLLRDVYSVKTVPAGDPQNPQKTTNVLVSRSKEWHAPEYSLINVTEVLVIEPVTRGSRMDQLITEEKKQRSQ